MAAKPSTSQHKIYFILTVIYVYSDKYILFFIDCLSFDIPNPTPFPFSLQQPQLHKLRKAIFYRGAGNGGDKGFGFQTVRKLKHRLYVSIQSFLHMRQRRFPYRLRKILLAEIRELASNRGAAFDGLLHF